MNGEKAIFSIAIFLYATSSINNDFKRFLKNKLYYYKKHYYIISISASYTYIADIVYNVHNICLFTRIFYIM
jgi:hypothetical protein